MLQSQNALDKPETLTLYNVTKNDEGWYVCVALNHLGNATAKGYLSVVDCKYKNENNIDPYVYKIFVKYCILTRNNTVI